MGLLFNQAEPIAAERNAILGRRIRPTLPKLRDSLVGAPYSRSILILGIFGVNSEGPHD